MMSDPDLVEDNQPPEGGWDFESLNQLHIRAMIEVGCTRGADGDFHPTEQECRCVNEWLAKRGVSFRSYVTVEPDDTAELEVLLGPRWAEENRKQRTGE
jgi:hypothetical protein